jgi:hypothetical protein
MTWKDVEKVLRERRSREKKEALLNRQCYEQSEKLNEAAEEIYDKGNWDIKGLVSFLLVFIISLILSFYLFPIPQEEKELYVMGYIFCSWIITTTFAFIFRFTILYNIKKRLLE